MKIRLLSTAVLALASAAVLAQAPAPSPEMIAARAAAAKSCQGDTEKMCKGKEGHEGMMCLRTMQDHLTPDCKTSLDKLAKLAAPR